MKNHYMVAELVFTEDGLDKRFLDVPLFTDDPVLLAEDAVHRFAASKYPIGIISVHNMAIVAIVLPWPSGNIFWSATRSTWTGDPKTRKDGKAGISFRSYTNRDDINNRSRRAKLLKGARKMERMDGGKFDLLDVSIVALSIALLILVVMLK